MWGLQEEGILEKMIGSTTSTGILGFDEMDGLPQSQMLKPALRTSASRRP